MTKSKITQLILNSAERVTQARGENRDIKFYETSDLYGGASHWDSLHLVRFVVDLEEGLEANLGKSLKLVNEKSLTLKTNPFSNVHALTSYIEELLKTNNV